VIKKVAQTLTLRSSFEAGVVLRTASVCDEVKGQRLRN